MLASQTILARGGIRHLKVSHYKGTRTGIFMTHLVRFNWNLFLNTLSGDTAFTLFKDKLKYIKILIRFSCVKQIIIH